MEDRCITFGSGTLVQADSSLRILATKQEIEDHFSTHGTGKITEIKLMNGFGFIEYEDAMDARDIVPG
jgi:RNA recognition motif. (a.k.a. RRM, RBD, or RNP domain)